MVDTTSNQSRMKTFNFENLETVISNMTEMKLNEITIHNVDKLMTPDEINNISTYLEDGAKLNIEFKSETFSSEDEIKSFITNLKFAGFMKICNENNTALSCTKKVWGKSKNKNQWKNIVPEYKGDLIVEEELVDPFDTYQKFSKETDCITKPKACKNCNCGRAEKENSGNQAKLDPNFKPECGKCYLGDAFRCAGCPFRGLPAFEPGQKIEFNKIAGTSDVVIEEEKSGINVKNKKVKIDL